MEKEKSKREVKLKKILEYLMPAILTIAIFLFAMIIKGIVPFGNKSLSYIDYNAGLVPSYTGLWDWLHGKASFSVSFNLGAGGALYASYILNSFLSPISWLIAIFPKTQIMFGIAFLIILKLALMATTAYLCFKKFFPNINKWVLLLFTMCWVYSGWTIVHFTNVGWLDLMVLLPILLLSAKKLIDDGKCFWFIVILSYLLILSYYITYMILVGVVVISTVYFFTIGKKETRKRTISLLFFSIIISLLISFFAFIPSCITSLQSHRFTDLNANPKKELIQMFFSKFSTLTMITLPLVFFVKLIATLKKDKENVLFFLLSFCLCGVGLIIEPINKMWHTGSYFGFPFRYSFILILIMIFGSLYYLNKYVYSAEPKSDKNKGLKNELNANEIENDNSNQVLKKKSSKKIWADIGLMASVFAFIVSGLVLAGVGVESTPGKEIFYFAFIFYLLNAFGFYYIVEYLLRNKNKKLLFAKINGGVGIFVLCFIQIITFAIGYVGMPFKSVQNTAQVSNAFEINTSNFDNGFKLKDADMEYNPNFAYFINYPTTQTWIHISSEEQYQMHHALGYANSNTILYSYGGTYLSDVLVGNKYIVSKKVLNPNYFKKIDEIKFVNEQTLENEIKYVYELNFKMMPAWISDVDLDSVLEKDGNLIDNQNKIYKAFYGKTENIMNSIPLVVEKLDDKFLVKFTISADNIGKNIYLLSETNNIMTKVNNSKVVINSGFNDLGIMQEGDVVVEINKADNAKLFNTKSLKEIESIVANFKVASFDVETFKGTHNAYASNANAVEVEVKNSKLNVKVSNSTNQKYLFVPYINLKDMKAVVNNKNVDISNAIFNYMQIEIENGESNIEISYTPQKLKLCGLISLVAFLIFAIFSILNYFFKFSENKVVIWIGVGGACLILGVVGLLVYVKPFFSTFVILFSWNWSV